MKKKMIITSIIYAIMISCTHITFPMDDANPLAQSTSQPKSPRNLSASLIFYSKENDRKFNPIENPDAAPIILEKNSTSAQGYIRKEDGIFEIYRNSIDKDKKDKIINYGTISEEDVATIKKLVAEHTDIYIQPTTTNSNIFSQLNLASLTPIDTQMPVFTQGQAARMPADDTRATIGYADAEYILRQQYQQEDTIHLQAQQERKRTESQGQLSRSSSSDYLPPVTLRKGSSSNLRLQKPRPTDTVDTVIDTPELIRSANHSRNQSPTQSLSGTQSTPDSHTGSSMSNSGDTSTSPVSTPLHQTSPTSSSAKLNKNAPSEKAVTDALNALNSSGDNSDPIDDNEDFLEDVKRQKFVAEKTPLTTLEQLAEAEKIIDQNEDMIEQALEPIVGAAAAQAIVAGAEAALDIAQDLLSPDILTGRPLATMDDFKEFPCYDILATTVNNDSTLSITFADAQDLTKTKTISVALLQPKKPIIPAYIVIENAEGNADYVLKYVEKANPAEPEISSKKDSLPAPYYKQYPGRAVAGCMGILAAFIMIAYHYDHLPESMMSMLDQLKDLVIRSLPFTQSL